MNCYFGDGRPTVNLNDVEDLEPCAGAIALDVLAGGNGVACAFGGRGISVAYPPPPSSGMGAMCEGVGWSVARLARYESGRPIEPPCLSAVVGGRSAVAYDSCRWAAVSAASAVRVPGRAA